MSLFMWSPDNLLADKVWIFLALLVLLITLIFRKHCYICMWSEEKVVEKKVSYTQTKKEEAVNTKKQTVKKKQVAKEKDDDEIKIYVEKEIK